MCGLARNWALLLWVQWCVILLSLLTVGLVLEGGLLWVCFAASFSSSFPVGCYLVIRGRFVVRLLESGVFAKCTWH